jgi:hypothetical protein
MSDEERFTRSIDESRRSFIKKLVGVAFAAPVIASFALDNLAAAQPGTSLPNQIGVQVSAGGSVSTSGGSTSVQASGGATVD